ncbi:MAG: tRNA (N(6)-L-threonylcarbamoyladenosine(37)-C(2))-methylthiotransferase MtaB [Treponema sp.]|nr:tRNA (N(6)-L-threonylcarbamoyladenosine(37)-C(2))-methylthiotransferase MtaB [Treponema sp.]
MPAILILTLGCKLNQLESEAIADAYSAEGYDLHSENSGDPSLIIINTCTVTSKADQKARRVIRKALRDYPDARVIVTGCYAQLNKDDILKLDTDGKERLSVAGKDKIISKDKNDLFQFNPKKFSNHTRSFLKIQDGCDKRCSYCKIRLARGPSVSLEAEEVLKRLRVLEETHAEAVLTGVNISQYKEQGRKKNLTAQLHGVTRSEEERAFGLSELLYYLLSGTKKIAIRLSSLAPESADEKLCGILRHPRIRPHFHLSVQSGSDKILEKMGRVYNAQTVERAVSLLRSAKEDPFLACDIITGFPGETETEFEQTLNLCRKLDFAWIHVFPYSKRQGTPAFSFKGSVTENEVTKRVRLLTDLAKKGRAEYIRRWIGKEVDVVAENSKKQNPGFYSGVSGNYLKALVRCTDCNPMTIGKVLRCKLSEIAESEAYDVLAEPVL